jgi:rhodanese-related sulfurtransferase
MTKKISTEKLQSMRQSPEGFLLIDVLSRESFAKDHIPGARCVPLESPDFVAAVAEKASGSKTRKVVLYCSGPACDASARGAQMLIDGGFTTVLQYEGGLDAWNEAKRTRQARAARAV